MRGRLMILVGGLLLIACLFTLTALPTEAAPTSVSGTIHTINLKAKTVTIKQVNGSTLTLHVTTNTSIVRNGNKARFKSLALLDSVTANYNATTKNASKLNANGPATKIVSGSVLTAQKGTGILTLAKSSIHTNSNTRIVRNGKVVSLTLITNRDRLTAHLKPGTNTALDVIDEGLDEGQIDGAITAINGDAVTITPTGGGSDVTVTVNADTQIEVNGEDAVLGDLQLNMVVTAEYDPTTLVAFAIEAQDEGETIEISGTVAAVDTTNGTLTINPDGGGTAVMLNVDAGTEIQVNGEDAALDDVQVNMTVQAEYDSATMVANQIEAGDEGGGD